MSDFLRAKLKSHCTVPFTNVTTERAPGQSLDSVACRSTALFCSPFGNHSEYTKVDKWPLKQIDVPDKLSNAHEGGNRFSLTRTLWF